MSTIKVFPDSEALSRYAAELFIRSAQEAVSRHGRFAVALSGGSSPRRTYEILAGAEYSEQVPWQETHIFWGDERCVPPDSPESNAGEAERIWLNNSPIPESNVHAVNGSLKSDVAAQQYDDEIVTFFRSEPVVFDLVFLGLGENGHTASLFPDTDVLDEQKRTALEVYVAEQDMYRVTLTAPVINRAALTAFLVFGGKKADVVHEVLEGPPDPRRLPAQLIRPTGGQLYWLLDESAASRIKESEYETIR